MTSSSNSLPHVAPQDENDAIPTAPLCVSILEAARITGLGKTTVYEAMQRGDLPAVKAGNRTLVTMDGLRFFIANLPPYNKSKSSKA